MARAVELLRRAVAVYDAPGSALADGSRSAWRTGFASGALWMRLALENLRGQQLPDAPTNLNRIGFIKYGLATTAAASVIGTAGALDCWPLLLLSVPAFYVVEAQMVFLFPLLLDGLPRPFRTSRRWTVRAGGTFAVTGVVLQLAVCMLFGGFVGRGFVRSWCLGCLAICLWYEDLRLCRGESPSSSAPLAR